MINTVDLITIARERLTDAEALLHAHRYDSAVYMCGYSVEIALKYKICLTLNWTAFPSTNHDFENYKSMKTHNLSVLLHFTGIETTLRQTYSEEWSAVTTWNPEIRYKNPGFISQDEATLIVNSAQTLISIL